MRFRAYQHGDVEAMYRLDMECFSGPFQFDRDLMRDLAESPLAIVVVAVNDVGDANGEDDGLPGFIIAHVEGAGRHRHAYIDTIDVAERARRTGTGAELLRRTEEQARRSGLDRMELHVAVDNAGAIAFYEREGYEQVGRAKGFYREAGRDALMYVKKL
jgi:ribosomal protein S18 acetylase RimI-like enzyme